MGAYNYKYVRDQIPPFITDNIPDYEGTCDYDGDLWIAASNYIDELEHELAFQIEKSKKVSSTELYDWLSTRKPTTYVGGPVISLINKD